MNNMVRLALLTLLSMSYSYPGALVRAVNEIAHAELQAQNALERHNVYNLLAACPIASDAIDWNIGTIAYNEYLQWTAKAASLKNGLRKN